MKKRGGYCGNLKNQIKVRVSPETFDKLQTLAELEDKAIAWVIRSILTAGLEGKKTS
jgi:hypothetical protein